MSRIASLLAAVVVALAASVAGGQSSGSNGSSTLNDSAQGWGTDAWARMWVFITGGTGRGRVLQITSNTSTQLTVSGSWTVVPDATSTYAILGDGKCLMVAQALGTEAPRVSPRLAVVPVHPAPVKAPSEFLSLDRVMIQHIETALTQTRGRIEGPEGAAALLGINPHTLRARMRKLHIDWRRFRAVRRQSAA